MNRFLIWSRVLVLLSCAIYSAEAAFVWTNLVKGEQKMFFERPCRESHPDVDNQFQFSVTNPNDTATAFEFTLTGGGYLKVENTDNIRGLVSLTTVWDFEVDSAPRNVTVNAKQGTVTESVIFEATPMDSNDELPVFGGGTPLTLNIPENDDAFAINITVTDRDITKAFGTDSIVFYIEGDDGEFFDIEGITFTAGIKTGLLSLLKPLDFENNNVFSLTLTAEDGPDTYCGFRNNRTFHLTVNVVDDEDLPPRFRTIDPSVTIVEELPIGSFVAQVFAEDGDRGINNPIKYSIISGNDGGWFTIGADDGYITTQGIVDIESSDIIDLGRVVELVVLATEVTAKPQHPHTTTNKVSVYILDIDDSPPKFNELFFNARIVGNAAIGAAVSYTTSIHPQVTDPDLDGNSGYTFSIVDSSGAFAIQPVNGTGTTLFISLIVANDTQLAAFINKSIVVQIVATDVNNPAFRDTAVVEVAVTASLANGEVEDVVELRQDANEHHRSFDSKQNLFIID